MRLEINLSAQVAPALVAGGEAAPGVYPDTDVTRSPDVRVAGIAPDGSHPPIVCQAPLTDSGSAAASEFLTYLRGAGARRVFGREGFGFVSRPERCRRPTI